ncbi:DsbE family thiol:disulfide interchange protein [Candidatus Pelagibacter bacterium]|nr:DsbE family thiol:disulfide interchange protein [Candidatus Pelagibacter bacterium]
MKIKIIKISITIFFLFITLVFLIGLNKSSIYDTKDLVGKQLENIKLDIFNENKILTESDLRKNEFTLINFWASWCGPCRKEHPTLLRLNRINNLTILGVNFKDKKQNAKKFLNELGNPYDILAKDELGKDSVYFGIYGIPESILIDKNLTVIKKFVGPISKNEFNYIVKTVEK